MCHMCTVSVTEASCTLPRWQVKELEAKLQKAFEAWHMSEVGRMRAEAALSAELNTMQRRGLPPPQPELPSHFVQASRNHI